MKNRKLGTRMVLTAVLLLCCIAGAAPAADAVKDKGTLSEVRENGTVMIDDHGYEVASSLVVIDGQGKRVSLKDLQLPTVVQFEYRYRVDRGPEIRLMREIPQ